MAVSSTIWKASFTGNGEATAFLCAFALMEESDLKVYVDDALQVAGRDYSLSGIVKSEVHTIEPGYSVVFTEAPSSGAGIYIRRQTPRWNSIKVNLGDAFSLPAFESAYDALAMMFQEIAGIFVEGFQGPSSESAPNVDYQPQSSGFFSAKIIGGPDSGFYRLRASIPTAAGGWSTTALPILTEIGAEINGRTDLVEGDVVLVLPIADTAGSDAWRFVANQSCGEAGGTPYEGSFYDIARCDNSSVLEVAWVRSDEFDPDDVFEIGGVCYVVKGTSPAEDPSIYLTLRLSDVAIKVSCESCLVGQDAESSSPPIEGSRFRNMISCDDGSDDTYSLPVSYFGVPTNHDLTKTYRTLVGIDYECFSVGTNETAFPENPLFPVHAADVLDDCDDCEPSFCEDCTNNPESAFVSGLSGSSGCLSHNAEHIWQAGSVYSSYCEKTWSSNSGSNLELYTAREDIPVFSYGSYETELLRGETLAVFTDTGLDNWIEKTTGFSCSLDTGKISGAHQFSAESRYSDSSCDGNPLVVIDP